MESRNIEKGIITLNQLVNSTIHFDGGLGLCLRTNGEEITDELVDLTDDILTKYGDLPVVEMWSYEDPYVYATVIIN